MSEEIGGSLKDELFASLRRLRDYYKDFDVCTWAFVEDADEVNAIIEYIREYPEAATEDVITFQEWYHDQSQP